MSTRARRHALVRELVSTRAVRSQAQLVALLGDHGCEATQATVSRDLEELGIGKVRGADGATTYATPDGWGLPRLLRQFALSIDASGNLAVVTTPPGAAATIASAIDTSAVSDVLATVQGDDTILVVAKEPATGRQVADLLARLKDPDA